MAMIQPLPPVPRSGAPALSNDGADSGSDTPLAQMPEEPSQGNQAQDKAQTLMRQLMDQRRANEALAAQYPPAAKPLRAANEALKQAMLLIVREVQQTPGSNPAPPVGPG